MSGADLANLVNEAALFAARRGKRFVEMDDFESAKDKIMMGAERRSMVMPEEERRNTAYHESGHAVVAKLLPKTDPVHKVTIIPRGRALGLTQQLPLEDRLNLSREAANDQIAVAMGGRVVEELVFGQITTGASNDISMATDLAHKMVCEWGMSEKIGPLHFGRNEEMVFLGRDFAEHKEYSEQTAVDIDAEVRRIVTANHERAKQVITGNMDKLNVLAEALLEYETIDGAEIDVLFAGGKLDRVPTAPVSVPGKDGGEQKQARPGQRSGLFPRPLPDPEKA
jgi:cell division protease FtsH